MLGGLASTATLFAHDAASLYWLRALVGITEAGYLPGVLLYMTFWFPAAYRARANALFMIAMPFTAGFGSVLSGAILGLDGHWGLAGWQWLFLLEGLPSVVLGLAVYGYLDDQPRQAHWLRDDEKLQLAELLEQTFKQFPLTPAGGVSYCRQQCCCSVWCTSAWSTRWR